MSGLFQRKHFSLFSFQFSRISFNLQLFWAQMRGQSAFFYFSLLPQSQLSLQGWGQAASKTHFHSLLASPRKRAWEEQPQVTASPDPSTRLAELIYFSPVVECHHRDWGTLRPAQKGAKATWWVDPGPLRVGGGHLIFEASISEYVWVDTFSCRAFHDKLCTQGVKRKDLWDRINDDLCRFLICRNIVKSPSSSPHPGCQDGGSEGQEGP